MKKYLPLGIIIFAVVMITVFSCSYDLVNITDSKGENYQGYPTYSDPDELYIVSPESGENFSEPEVTVTSIVGSNTVYAARIALSEALLKTANVYEKSDYTSNVFDFSSAPLWNNTTYWIQSRSSIDGGTTWGRWSAAISFTTSFSESNKVETPVINLSSGTYSSDQSVTISCSTAGATIYYTTDGSDPTASSTQYSGAISVAGDGASLTINAMAAVAGYTESDIVTGNYVIDYNATAMPVFSPVAGTYNSDQEVTISCETNGATVYYTTDGSTPTTSSAVYSGVISVAGHGTSLTLKAIAVADGLSDSNIASVTYTYTTATPTMKPEAGTYSNDKSVTISCLTSGATIYYTSDGSNPTTESTVYSGAISVAGHGTNMLIKAIAFADGYSTSSLGIAEYIINYPTVSTPIFSPEGGVYKSNQNITISCATEGATIYYTKDGSDPFTSVTRLSGVSEIGPIEVSVSEETTLRAIAEFSYYLISEEAVATYKDHYNIGDEGPAGGLIFYDKGEDATSWRYIEVAPASTEWGSVIFGGAGVMIYTTIDILGYADSNTEYIYDALESVETGDYAAKLCKGLSYNGYTDWWLPTPKELLLIYENIHLLGLGGFSNYWYWSSVDFSDIYAEMINFSNGSQQHYGRGSEVFVRAIRYISP